MPNRIKYSCYGDTQKDNTYTPEEVRAMLPKVGDRLRKVPTMPKEQMESPGPMWCQVVYVNLAHLFYTVQFQEKGCRFRESYKVPEGKGE